jgi:hypothetical protein
VAIAAPPFEASASIRLLPLQYVFAYPSGQVTNAFTGGAAWTKSRPLSAVVNAQCETPDAGSALAVVRHRRSF